MIGSRPYYPINILTNRGVVELKNIIPGDYVYEYKTGNLLKVIGIDEPCESLITHVIYNDKRIEYVRESDSIYTGNNIIESRFINSQTKFTDITQYPIELKNRVTTLLDPDPYLAGAFLTYGIINDPYVNLPYYMTGINDVFSNKYSIEYASNSVGLDGRVYFKYINDPSGKRITWKQLFGEDIKLDKLFQKYLMSSIKNRTQFIRGIFDMGYSPALFRNNKIGVVCSSKTTLEMIQNILWSLGILSKVEYDDFIDPYHNNKYKLEIIDKHIGYPGFTYILENIEYLLDKDNQIISYEPQFTLKIRSNSSPHTGGFYLSYGTMGNLVLEKPKALYLTSQFLPRVSM